MKRWFLLLLFCATLRAENYSIVFVHIGDKVPAYAEYAFAQARLFNKDCDIYLICNASAKKNFTHRTLNNRITIITCESIKMTEEHQQFVRNSQLDRQWYNGFWNHTTERFFYIHDLIVERNLKNVFHLENDVMIYVNLAELLPTFAKYYRGMAATYDNDDRCIPGFVYFADKNGSGQLCASVAKTAADNVRDMDSLTLFRKHNPKETIDTLPIIMSEYAAKNTLQTNGGRRQVNDPTLYYNHYDVFGSIFDAAALGQYLGGTDPNIAAYGRGFVNECCIFDPAKLKFEWKRDHEGRLVPYAIYGNTCCRVNNLHIHSKKTHEFMSKW